jgi:uncharacterized coiled-coil protein SlyX
LKEVRGQKMTKDELEKATGKELIEQRDYCGADGYYGDYLDDVNAEMLKRFNRLAELEKRCANYEMTISKMEKGTCDICKETEKDNRIVELEEKISVLLSCKNCPENKGGYICAKEYENKCLAQKMQFIKELQEENAELKEKLLEQKQYTAFKCNEAVKKKEVYEREHYLLTKAKELLKKWVELYKPKLEGYPITPIQEQTEQFLSEVKK